MHQAFSICLSRCCRRRRRRRGCCFCRCRSAPTANAAPAPDHCPTAGQAAAAAAAATAAAAAAACRLLLRLLCLLPNLSQLPGKLRTPQPPRRLLLHLLPRPPPLRLLLLLPSFWEVVQFNYCVACNLCRTLPNALGQGCPDLAGFRLRSFSL